MPLRRGSARWTLLAVCVANSLLLFNVVSPNVAFSAVAAELGGSFSDLQWIISGYALSLAALQLAGGRMADRWGRRRVFLTGLSLFVLASALCALFVCERHPKRRA